MSLLGRERPRTRGKVGAGGVPHATGHATVPVLPRRGGAGPGLRARRADDPRATSWRRCAASSTLPTTSGCRRASSPRPCSVPPASAYSACLCALPPEEVRMRGRHHGRRRDRAAVTHHYDLGNDFYRLRILRVSLPRLEFPQNAPFFVRPDTRELWPRRTVVCRRTHRIKRSVQFGEDELSDTLSRNEP